MIRPDNLVALTEQDRNQLTAAARLRELGPAGVPQLIGMLGTVAWPVRREVIATLAALGKPAVEPLVEFLRTERSSEAAIAAAVDALAASSAALGEALEPMVQDPNPAVVADAAQILGRRRDAAHVPVLARLVEHEDDNVAVSAIEALGRTRGAGGTRVLISAVKSGNFFRVFPAIDVLGRRGDPQVVPPLADLLDDPTYAMEAARALGRTGEAAAVAPLASLLAARSESMVRVVAVALGELYKRYESRYGIVDPVDDALRRSYRDPSVARRLARCLNNADQEEQIAIARLLGILGGETEAVALAALLGAGPAVAEAAAVALKRLDQRAESHIREVLLAGESGQRLALLPTLQSSAGAAEIAACLTDPDPRVRVLACESLARLGATGALPALFDRLDDSNPRVAQAAIGAINSLGQQETEVLALEAAQSEDPQRRRGAMRILAYFGYPSALPTFERALESGDRRVVEIATGGLALIEDRRALEVLLEAARAPNPGTRAAALRALSQCVADDMRIASRLFDGLSDEDPWVRYFACQSLGRLGIESATARIVPLMHDDAGQVRVAAVEALSHFHSDAAYRALVDATETDDGDIRRAALIGLGLLGRSEALPLLRRAARAPDQATRLVAVSALAGMKDPEVPRLIARLAHDETALVRVAARELLAERPGQAATAALIELLADEGSREPVVELLAIPVQGRVAGLLNALPDADDEMAPILASLLARLRTADAAMALIQAMSLPASHVRRAAARALASLQTEAAWELLRRAGESDPDPEVRTTCAVLLAG